MVRDGFFDVGILVKTENVFSENVRKFFNKILLDLMWKLDKK